MNSRVILVGQAPGQGLRACPEISTLRPATFHHDPFALIPARNSSGGKFMQLLGMTIEEYDETFDRRNLVAHFHGKSGKGDRFDRATAERGACMILEEESGRRFVAFGRSVAKLLGHSGKFLETERDLFCLPHTSGVNRWWNDPENKKMAVEKLRLFLSL